MAKSRTSNLSSAASTRANAGYSPLHIGPNYADQYDDSPAPMNANLKAAVEAAAKNFPLSVTAVSGGRHPSKTEKGNHSKGYAIDAQIKDQQGRVLDNFQDPTTYRAYEALSQQIHLELEKQVQEATTPAARAAAQKALDNHVFGGTFGGVGKHAKPMDTMHNHITPGKRGNAGDLDVGFTGGDFMSKKAFDAAGGVTSGFKTAGYLGPSAPGQRTTLGAMGMTPQWSHTDPSTLSLLGKAGKRGITPEDGLSPAQAAIDNAGGVPGTGYKTAMDVAREALGAPITAGIRAANAIKEAVEKQFQAAPAAPVAPQAPTVSQPSAPSQPATSLAHPQPQGALATAQMAAAQTRPSAMNVAKQAFSPDFDAAFSAVESARQTAPSMNPAATVGMTPSSVAPSAPSGAQVAKQSFSPDFDGSFAAASSTMSKPASALTAGRADQPGPVADALSRLGIGGSSTPTVTAAPKMQPAPAPSYTAPAPAQQSPQSQFDSKSYNAAVSAAKTNYDNAMNAAAKVANTPAPGSTPNAKPGELGSSIQTQDQWSDHVKAAEAAAKTAYDSAVKAAKAAATTTVPAAKPKDQPFDSAPAPKTLDAGLAGSPVYDDSGKLVGSIDDTGKAVGLTDSPMQTIGSTLKAGLVGGPISGIAAGIASALGLNTGYGINSAFGGPQPQMNAPPTTSDDVIGATGKAGYTGKVDNGVMARANQLGLGKAPEGYHYGWSPTIGVASVADSAPESVHIAASGSGLLGALGLADQNGMKAGGVKGALGNAGSSVMSAIASALGLSGGSGVGTAGGGYTAAQGGWNAFGQEMANIGNMAAQGAAVFGSGAGANGGAAGFGGGGKTSSPGGNLHG